MNVEKLRQALQEIAWLCRRYAHPGVNTTTHELAARIAKMAENALEDTKP